MTYSCLKILGFPTEILDILKIYDSGIPYLLSTLKKVIYLINLTSFIQLILSVSLSICKSNSFVVWFNDKTVVLILI